MLAWFVLGISILLGITLAGRWFATADPKLLVKMLTRVGLGALIGLVVFLAVTGRLAFAVPLIIGAFWWLVRNGLKNLFFQSARKAFSSAASNASGGASGGSNQSDIKTDYLRMTLDHRSGEISGEVLRGRFQGAQLTALTTAEVVELIRECRSSDPKSANLLETYLDKTVGPDWREAPGNEYANEQASTGAEGPMTREEALEVLGLAGRPESDEIKAAHHKLMQKMHPDRGGSTWLASKINQARDLLLNA